MCCVLLIVFASSSQLSAAVFGSGKYIMKAGEMVLTLMLLQETAIAGKETNLLLWEDS